MGTSTNCTKRSAVQSGQSCVPADAYKLTVILNMEEVSNIEVPNMEIISDAIEEPPIALTHDLASKSLRKLGRHPITLQHALLEMVLPNKNLKTIDAMCHFPNIMHLDISNNKISSLEVLSKLVTLVELNARYSIVAQYQCANVYQ